MDNYSSTVAPAVRDKVENALLEEIAAGNYVISSKKPTIIGALSAVPKPNSEEIRLIHDCSQPSGSAVNDYADAESFKYQSLQDAIKLLKPGYFMAKIDLQHAYRSVGIHPNNFDAMGLKWKFGNSKHFTFLYDTKLSYGGRRAPGIFHRLTQAVKRMMKRTNFEDIVVYLDDFLVIGPTLEECTEVFNCLLSLLQQLGFDISWHKVVYPTQQLVFLGVLLDSISQSMSLPEDKLYRLSY